MPDEEVIMRKATTITFASIRGLLLTPYTEPNGRVAFKAKGNVSEVLAELQTNPLIPVLDFIQRLEAIRSIIFTMKNNGNAG
jgi:hypothetical protein